MDVTVDTSSLKKYSGTMKASSGAVKKALKTAQSVGNGLDTSMQSYSILADKLDRTCLSLTTATTKLDKLSSGLLSVAGSYEDAETTITGNVIAKRIGKTGVSTFRAVNQTKDKGITSFEDLKAYLYELLPPETANYVINTLSMAGAVSGMDFDGIKIEYKYTGTTKKGTNRKAEAGVLIITIPGRKGLLSTDAVLVIGQASAGTSSKINLKRGSGFEIKNKAYAKVTGVELEMTNTLGTKYNNVYQKYKLSIMDAEVSAKESLDKNGIKFSAGAEGKVVSLSGTKGATSGGIKVEADMEMYYGAGAKAEASIGTDGASFKHSVGFGPGISLGGNIDFSSAGEYLNYVKRAIKYQLYKRKGCGYSYGGGGRGAFGGGNIGGR